MRALLCIIVIVCCAGCAHTKKAFVQDGIRIVPPVTQEGYDKDTEISTLSIFNDGGTRWFKIRDAECNRFDVYVDHRIGSTTPGAIYLVAYPGKPETVLVLDQKDFRKKIGVFE